MQRHRYRFFKAGVIPGKYRGDFEGLRVNTGALWEDLFLG